MPAAHDPEFLANWSSLWGGCDFFPDEHDVVNCAYCDRDIADIRVEGIDSVDIYWLDKEILGRLDIPSWQKKVLAEPEEVSLCERCGKPLWHLGWAFFLHAPPSLEFRLSWQRTALYLLASKLLRVKKHEEYLQDTGFYSFGYRKDTH